MLQHYDYEAQTEPMPQSQCIVTTATTSATCDSMTEPFPQFLFSMSLGEKTAAVSV